MHDASTTHGPSDWCSGITGGRRSDAMQRTDLGSEREQEFGSARHVWSTMAANAQGVAAFADPTPMLGWLRW